MNLNSSFYNNYLSRYDMSYKYKINNIHNIPKIELITLDFPLAQISNNLNISTNSKYLTSTSFYLCYFMFYITFLIFPYINFKTKKKQDLKNYALKFNIKEKKKLQEFFYNFILCLNDNSNKFVPLFKVEENLILKKNYSSSKVITNLIYKLPIYYIYDLNLFFNEVLPELNSKNLEIYINLKCNTFGMLKLNLKNLHLFWM